MLVAASLQLGSRLLLAAKSKQKTYVERIMTAKGATARYLAIFDAIAFLVFAALFIWLILSPEQAGGVSWQQVAVSVAYLTGAPLLFAGAVRWYGRGPWLLRLAGCGLLFISAAANVSFAFMTIPLLLPAFFSLRKHERGERRHTRRAAPGDLILVLGSVTLSFSIFVPWYDWLFQNGLSSHSTQVTLWDASTVIAVIIMAADLVALGIIALPLVADYLGRWKPVHWPRWKDLILLGAVALASVLTGFRMLVIPVGAGAISGSFAPGFFIGLAGMALLLFGEFLRLLQKRAGSISANGV